MAVYAPQIRPLIPRWLVDRIDVQGLSTAATILAAEAAAATTAGDTASAAAFTSWLATVSAMNTWYHA